MYLFRNEQNSKSNTLSMPQHVRLATYNLKNFSIYASNHQSFDIKYNALLKVINAINADILALQEIDGFDSLEALNCDLKKSYPYISFHETNSQRQIHFAFMSRYPYKTTSHRKTRLYHPNNDSFYENLGSAGTKIEPAQFCRDALQADIELSSAQKISVFNLHLKSNIPTDLKNYSHHEIRHAESYTTAKIVQENETRTQNPTVIMGDFNQSSGHYSISPLSPDFGYYDLIESELSQSDQSISTFQNKFRQSRIDYVLLSPKAKEYYVKDTIQIYNDYPAEDASDHYPVHFMLKI